MNTRRRLPLIKRVAFFVVAMLVLLAIAEAALRIAGIFLAPNPDEVASDPRMSPCESLVFLCIGDSITFGLGAEANESYPMKFPGFFKKRFPDIPAKVINLGTPGASTSTSVRQVQTFFDENPNSGADFALILLGKNNQHNLIGATFWDWDRKMTSGDYFEYIASQLKLTHFFKIATVNAKAMVERVRNANLDKQQALSDHEATLVQFGGVDQDLFVRWLQYDFELLAGTFRQNGVEPIILNYHFDSGLNKRIAALAKQTSARLLDVEKPKAFYLALHMLDRDDFHMNATGYRFLAKQIVTEFAKAFTMDNLSKRLKAKQKSPGCESSSTN